jgi:Asp/Glu/hydantoin racemase
VKKLALIHTVPTVYAAFPEMVRSALNDVKTLNMVDEYLASDPDERGVFTKVNRSRLFAIVKCAEATEANVILTTCSTLSPIIEEIRPFVSVPLVTIDEAMLRAAVARGESIAIVATADSTLGPTRWKLEREAEAAGKQISVSEFVCAEAYSAIKARKKDEHDRLVLDMVQDVSADVIVLAQASMAHLEDSVASTTGATVLSSPRMCIAQLAGLLNSVSTESGKV